MLKEMWLLFLVELTAHRGMAGSQLNPSCSPLRNTFLTLCTATQGKVRSLCNAFLSLLLSVYEAMVLATQCRRRMVAQRTQVPRLFFARTLSFPLNLYIKSLASFPRLRAFS